MEVTGKVIIALPEVAGVSKSGNNWKKREYVLETLESFPKKIHFDFFGERADQYPLNPGDVIRLSFDIESREYNGRWYTSIRGWKAEPAQEGAAAPQSAAFPTPQQPAYAAPAAAPAPQALPAEQSAPQGFPAPPAAPSATDDLPF